MLIPEDLGTYLGTTIDDTRAQLLIDMATKLCESIVSPLPDAADAVVLDVVTRAYTNPGMASQQGAGSFTVAYAGGNGGLWLTRQNKTTLRRLAGQGGAFTIDTMPATAGQSLPWWDVAASGPDGLGADWDIAP